MKLHENEKNETDSLSILSANCTTAGIDFSEVYYYELDSRLKNYLILHSENLLDIAKIRCIQLIDIYSRIFSIRLTAIFHKRPYAFNRIKDNISCISEEITAIAKQENISRFQVQEKVLSVFLKGIKREILLTLDGYFHTVFTKIRAEISQLEYQNFTNKDEKATSVTWEETAKKIIEIIKQHFSGATEIGSITFFNRDLRSSTIKSFCETLAETLELLLPEPDNLKLIMQGL